MRFGAQRFVGEWDKGQVHGRETRRLSREMDLVEGPTMARKIEIDVGYKQATANSKRRGDFIRFSVGQKNKSGYRG